MRVPFIRITDILMIAYTVERYCHFSIDLTRFSIYLNAVKSIQTYGMTRTQHIYMLCVLISQEGAMWLLRYV